MRYVVYNKETTVLLPVRRPDATRNCSFATERAAKAALTRALNNPKIKGVDNRDDWAIAPEHEFETSIEKMKTVKNLMSKKDVEIPVNTPYCCDPSTETYWSM